jgi:DNA-binding CsgD family transcriptional regulator
MTMLDHDPAEALSALTAKQTEVLDLLLQHKTTKQIARDLHIAPNTVDARIAAVREKWGTPNRNATARVYAHLLEACEKPPCGFLPLDGDFIPDQGFLRDLPGSPHFTVSDVQTFEHLMRLGERRTGLEALDARFGKFGRVGAIVLLAMLIAVTVVASLAIADSLGKFI